MGVDYSSNPVSTLWQTRLCWSWSLSQLLGFLGQGYSCVTYAVLLECRIQVHIVGAWIAHFIWISVSRFCVRFSTYIVHAVKSLSSIFWKSRETVPHFVWCWTKWRGSEVSGSVCKEYGMECNLTAQLGFFCHCRSAQFENNWSPWISLNTQMAPGA